MPSRIIKCAECNAIDSAYYGHWWPSVFPWAKKIEEENKKKLRA